MKIDIEHEEGKTGLVFKTQIYKIHTTVIFSEEEKYTIKKEKLLDQVVLERPPNFGKKKYGNIDWLYVRDLLKGKDTFITDTITRAKEYEHELIKALGGLKNMITNGADMAQTKSFEL